MARLTEEMIAGAEVAGQVPPQLDGSFVMRILETDNKPSKSSGNKMVSFTAEIVRPEKITRNGTIYTVAGLKDKFYFPIESAKGGEQTKLQRKAYKEFRQLMGLEPYFDLENPEHEDLRGLGFRVILHSEERIPMVMNEEGERVQLKDEATGQPVSRGWQLKHFNNEILSKVDLDAAA